MSARSRSGRAPARARVAGATRAALLQSAAAEFAERGYAGARVDEIASRAHVNKRMIYAYFGNKQGLFGEVLETRLAVSRAGNATSADARAALDDQVRWYFRLLDEGPAIARLLAWAMLVGARSGKRAVLLSSAAPRLDLLRDIVRGGIGAGSLRSDVEPELLRTAIASVCLGYFVQHEAMAAARAARGALLNDEAFLEGLCRVLFDGICARAADAVAEGGAAMAPEE